MHSSSQGSADITIIKGRGRRVREEKYDPDKLHGSIAGACISSGAPSGYAESIARKVVGEVDKWLESRPEVTSSDLRRIAAQKLKPYHPDASYLYEHNRSTL